MPNLKEHLVKGAAIGALTNLVWQLINQYQSSRPPDGLVEAFGKVNLFEVGAFAVIGAGIGALPDILEPAANPNHRKFFHSVAFGGVVFCGAFGEHSEGWSLEQQRAVRSIAMSYLSHLALDSHTPNGLPLI